MKKNNIQPSSPVQTRQFLLENEDILYIGTAKESLNHSTISNKRRWIALTDLGRLLVLAEIKQQEIAQPTYNKGNISTNPLSITRRISLSLSRQNSDIESTSRRSSTTTTRQTLSSSSSTSTSRKNSLRLLNKDNEDNEEDREYFTFRKRPLSFSSSNREFSDQLVKESKSTSRTTSKFWRGRFYGHSTI